MQFNRRLFHTKAKTAMSSGEWDAREVPLLPRGATAPAASTESGRRPGEQWDLGRTTHIAQRPLIGYYLLPFSEDLFSSLLIKKIGGRLIGLIILTLDVFMRMAAVL